MPYVGANAYSRAVITPDMETPSPLFLDAAASYHRSQEATWAGVQTQREIANAQREQAIQSDGSEAMHLAHRQAVQYIQQIRDLHIDAAKMYEEHARILRSVDSQQSNIDRNAHQQVSQAPRVQHPAIVAEHHSSAETMSTRAAGTIFAQIARWDTTSGAQLSALNLRLSPAPKPIEPTPNPSPGVAQPLDDKYGRKPRPREDAPKQPDQGDGGPTSTSGSSGEKGNSGAGGNSGEPDEAYNRAARGSSGAELPGPSPKLTPTPRPVSPLGGGGVPSGGGGSGAGGLGSGLGGGSSPLSSMMGGLGQSPASGLGSGLTSSNPAASLANSSGGPAAASNPGAAFARGLSSTGSAVPPVASTVSPPPAAMSPAPATQPLAAGGGPSGLAAPAAGAAGVHVAPAGIQSAPPVMSGGSPAAPPMMLPSTGMGNPAAPSSPVVPVGSSSGSTSPGGAVVGPSSAGPAAANTGATLVPAAVVSSSMATRPQKLLTEDAQSAAALAWQLQHACRQVSFPMDWAVGVFRASEGSETVVMSSEGSGYIPAGVYVSRGVRLLAADVDTEFRRTWFGWRDPAEVMVEYARRRQAGGWRLAAAATTGPTDQFRDFGTEYADQCTFERSPLTVDDPIPVLDTMHAHRLQLENADLYDRLVRLAGAQQVYVDRVMIPVAGEMVEAARSLEHPVELTRAWATLTGGGELTGEQWGQYAQVTSTEFLTTQILRPEAAGAPEEWKSAVYRDAWTVSRTLEVVAGWSSRPLPVADMAYAAITADPGGDVRDRISASLQQIEIELGWV